MNYIPMIASANSRTHYTLGKYTAILFDKIRSAGAVEYKFVLAVFDEQTKSPCLFVASEVNSTVKEFGGGSHFLGVFPGHGHENMGASDDWADIDKFTIRALAVVQERLKITE